jgi:hypothetical protein
MVMGSSGRILPNPQGKQVGADPPKQYRLAESQ